MVDRSVGDYFISDVDDTLLEDDDLLGAPLVVPIVPRQLAQPSAVQIGAVPSQTVAGGPTVVAPPMSAAPAVIAPAAAPAAPATLASTGAAPAPAPAPAPAAAPAAAAVPAMAAARPATREEQLTRALDELMHNDADIQAAALVSLDGFTMASALPAGMQSDRVGAMSAAILGLGERAAAELGRGHLSQVFIEGANGYVLLIAAGTRSVLTALAEKDSKLGLVLYDMKATAESIGRILG